MNQVNNNEIERFIIDNYLCIPKDDYMRLFKVKASYDFPTLKTDEDGIFTGETDEYDIFNKFQLIDSSYQYELKNPDIVAEKFIIKNKIKQMRIDLRNNIKGDFSNHKCFVYPEIIASNSAIYDTLYLTDYLLKHIYRILMAMIINGVDEEYIKQETYLISMKEIEGKYKVINIEYNYAFLRLIDMISNYISDNNLKDKQSELQSEYLEFKKENATLSASISYKDIKYTLQDNILTFKKLKEQINITCWKDDKEINLPSYPKYLQQFFNDYYDDIKKIFPIYNRLENIYRLCALNVILDNFSPETKIHDSVYIDTYPKSILCSGGILLAPTNFIKIPFNDNPVVKATQKNIDNKACKKAFDNGGLVCAFAPALLIEECYDNNEKFFHDCLKN